jgi:pimeloyl-ACP methyl ester carboxylesterase
MRSIFLATLALAAGLAALAQTPAASAAEPPPLPELRFVEIPAASKARYRGDRFSYMEAGKSDSPVVLFLHGVGANSMHWRFQYAGLSSRFRVIGWNAPGYMLTDNLRSETPTCKEYADAVADLADALGLTRFHLVGNSFGSRVAMCFVHHHPGRVIRLVTTGTSIGIEHPTEAQQKQTIAARTRQMSSGGYGFGSGRVSALLGSRGQSPETVALVQHVLRATNPEGFMQAVRFGALSGYYAPRFGQSLERQPFMMISGDEDGVSPRARNADVLAKVVPSARHEVLEGYGHLPEVETPDRVNALLMDFFVR